jgi:chromosomal replication initiation ATPase DnaA
MNSQEKAVVDIVCDVSGLSLDQIQSKSRNRKYAYTRSVLGYILRRIVGCTLIRTGEIIGRDHSTVIYYEKTYDDNHKYDKEYYTFANKVEEIYSENFTAIRLQLVNDKIADLKLRLDSLKSRRRNLIKKMG